METLKWIEKWYLSHCDGDWEHQYGFEITTIDNPGWMIKVDLRETELENLAIEHTLTGKSENDWYAFSIKDHLFNATGDPSKLQFLLELFRKVVEENSK